VLWSVSARRGYGAVDGQLHQEARSAQWGVADLDPAAVGADDLGDDGQSEADTAQIAVA
jgi:hypothetical protein